MPQYEAEFDQKVQAVCNIYTQAQELAKSGERVLCNDEMTGIQALERLAPGLPLDV
jgi:hypothetical protein